MSVSEQVTAFAGVAANPRASTRQRVNETRFLIISPIMQSKLVLLLGRFNSYDITKFAPLDVGDFYTFKD
jgi:hypothetical protein